MYISQGRYVTSQPFFLRINRNEQRVVDSSYPSDTLPIAHKRIRNALVRSTS